MQRIPNDAVAASDSAALRGPGDTLECVEPGTASVAEAASDAAPRTVSALVAWTTVGLLGMFYVLSSIDRSLFALMSPFIQKSIHISDVQLSLLQGAAFSIFFGLAGLPLGWAADRFSRRWVIFCGAVAWSFSAASCGLANSFTSLFIPRVGVGVGEASLAPSAYSLIGDLFPRRRLGFVYAMYGMSVNLGGGIATTLGAVVLGALISAGGMTLPFVGHREPWQAACMVIGLPGVLLAWLAFLIHEPPRAKITVTKDAASWAEFFAFIRREPKTLTLHFLSYPLVAMTIYTTGAWMPIFLTRVHHMNIVAVGAALGLPTAIVGVGGNVATGAFSDWLHAHGFDDAPYRIGVFAAIIGAPFGVAAFLVGNPLLCLVLYFLYALIAPNFIGTAAASLNVITPAPLRGKIFACYWMCMAVAGALGPYIAASLTERVFHDPMKVGWSLSVVMAVALTGGALCFALNMKGLRRIVRSLDARDAAAAGIVQPT